jgi:type I restriction enzyme M protein
MVKMGSPKKANGTFDHENALTGDDLIDYKIGRFQSGYSLRDALELIDELRFQSQKEKHELSHLYEAKIETMGNAGRNGGDYYTPRPLTRAMIEVTNPKLGGRTYDGALGSDVVAS